MTSGQEQRQRLSDLPGQTVYDSSGQKIGKVGQIWLDDETGQPEWATVNTGMFGSHESFMPMQGIRSRSEGQLQTPYSRDQVRDAPRIDPQGGHLDTGEEDRLYSHYQPDESQQGDRSEQTSGQTWQTGSPRGAGERESGHGESAAGQDTSGPTTDEAMTRSEEHLRVGTEQRESGHARLRKYVVTEHEEVTVPVSHEEVRVEREPIDETNRGEARSGPTISDEEHEMTLHEERPVVETEAVPMERVHLEKDQVSESETVSGDVRKEYIDTEGDVDTGRRESGSQETGSQESGSRESGSQESGGRESGQR